MRCRLFDFGGVLRIPACYAEEKPEGDPSKTEEGRESECVTPAVADGDGRDQQRRDGCSERAAAVGYAEAEGTLVGGEGLRDRLEAGGEGGAFTEAEHGARDAEADEAEHEAVAAGGDGPDEDCGERGEPEAGAIHPETPDGIGEHVAEAEDEDGVAVLRGGEM